MQSFKYYDRMIPAQDHLPINQKDGTKGLGNLIALPLQGRALKAGNSAFVDENWNAYPNQWECLKNIKRINNNFINEKIELWNLEGTLGNLGSDFDATHENQKPWDKSKWKICKEDISGNIEIVLSDKVYMSKNKMQPRMQNAFRRMAAFSNPEFYKKSHMGFNVSNIPRIIFCGYDEGEYICLPRALKDLIIDKLIEFKIPYTLFDRRCEGRTLDVQFKGELYEEQLRGANEILKHENGVLAATTSFGKTVVGAYIIAQRKVNTLIIVHNTEILKNWIEDLEIFLDVNEEIPTYQTKTGRKRKREGNIGKIYAGHNSLTGIIDVAIFSSLGKKDEINPIVENYGMVIMDECHHGAAQTVEDVVGFAKAKYVYGLTATPKREDGLEKKVFMQFGPIRFKYTSKERAIKQGINHYVYPRFTRMVSPIDLKISEAYKAVVESEQRNNQIIIDVEDSIRNGRTPLILTKFKEHASYLYKKLIGKADHIYLLQGGGSRKEKDYNRAQMKLIPEKESVILVAIDKYIGEGFNFPRLDTLMLTMPIAAESNVEQFAGRLHRDYHTKKDVIIYDYVDSHIRVLEKMYHKRLHTYKKIGYDICENIVLNKQVVNSIFDATSYNLAFRRDLEEANKEIIISSPLINQNKINDFINVIKSKQEGGVVVSIVTLSPKIYLMDKSKNIEKMIKELENNAINVCKKESMHEHFAIIDREIVWYGSMNLLSKEKEDDNLIRIKNKETALELMEIVFGKNEE